jgi:hypothetical protein
MVVSVNRDATVVGLPIPGCPVEAVTTETDWVVTGSNEGTPFKVYVSNHASKDEAIRYVALALRLSPLTLDWISAHRRKDVEMCVRMDTDWLRSRTL